MKNANIALFHKIRVNDESLSRSYQKNNEYCSENELDIYYTDIHLKL